MQAEGAGVQGGMIEAPGGGRAAGREGGGDAASMQLARLVEEAGTFMTDPHGSPSLPTPTLGEQQAPTSATPPQHASSVFDEGAATATLLHPTAPSAPLRSAGGEAGEAGNASAGAGAGVGPVEGAASPARPPQATPPAPPPEQVQAAMEEVAKFRAQPPSLDPVILAAQEVDPMVGDLG